MAPRAVWTGQLRLSLVSIPVEIYAATTSGPRVSFRQIHRPSGRRVRHEKTVKGIGPVDRDDIVKGYETEDGDYILIEPEEIDALRIETSKTLELLQFVGHDEIPPIYFDRPYYMVPKDDLAQDAYRVVRDALRAEGRTGLCQITLRGKEHLAAIRPCGDGLLLETLRYEAEIRDAEPIFAEIADAPAEDEMLDLAKELIARKTAPFDAGAFSDSYNEALTELIAAKRRDSETGRVAAGSEDEEGGENVVDLMAALRKSVAKGGKGSGSAAGSSGQSSGSSSGKSARKSAGKSSGKSESRSSGKSSGGRKKAS